MMRKQLHLFAVLLICTYISLMESSTVSEPHWVSFNPDTDALPADAIVGGYEHNETLYIGRTLNDKGYMVPGKYDASTRQFTMPYFAKSYIRNISEILCGYNYKWIETTTDNIPDGAVFGSISDVNNETLYIARADYEHNVIPGKVKQSDGFIYIPYKNKEIKLTTFEILVAINSTTAPPQVQSRTATPRVQSTTTIPQVNSTTARPVVHSTTTTPEVQSTTTTPEVQTSTTTPEVQSTTAAPRVQVSQCLIPRQPKTDYAMPLILIPSPAATWPMSDITADYLQVEPGQTVIFSCGISGGKTSYFQAFPERDVISASCIEQDKFMVENKSYKISELLCVEVKTTVFMRNREKCLSKTSELFRIGYEAHGFSETYKVCFDTVHNIPLYTHVMMSKSIRCGDVAYEWHQYHELDARRDSYTCNNVTSTCCYTKSQLVNACDVSAGTPQRTTFIDPLNAVPHWRPCGMTQSPWENIEDSVRSLLDTNDQIDVWSGTHMLQNDNGTVTPRYLWKVLTLNDTKSLAVVYVNGPAPSEADILCKNTCGYDEAVPWSYDYSEHTYCCNVDEFLHAFGLGGSAVGKSTQTSFDTMLRKKFSASNLLLRKLTERTSNIQMTQQLYFILVGHNYKWVPTTVQYIPDGAVVGGYIQDTYEPLFVGRVHYADQLLPGKVAVTHGVLYFGYEYREIDVTNFEILVFDDEVKEKPKITGEYNVTATSGQIVNIECQVTKGVPRPTISWQFRAKTNGTFVSVPGSDNTLNILLSNVDVTDAGTYKCVATNYVGDDEHLTELIVQETTISNANTRWVQFNPATDELPVDAIVGGYQHEPLFIARAPHEGSLTPGMYVPSTHKAFVTWANDAHPKTIFEILCGRNYEWVPTTTHYIPDGAVVGGYIENSDETEYVGRTNYLGQVIPGKVSHGVLYFAFEGRTMAANNFQILVNTMGPLLDKDLHWVKYNPETNKLPDFAVFGGYDYEPLFIARAPHEGSLTPGKFRPSTHEMIISWGGASYIKNNSEILCGLDYEWIPATTHSIPDRAFYAGYIENSHEPLFVGRSNYLGDMIPGKVAKSHGGMYLAYDNREIKVKHFEILTIVGKRRPKLTASKSEIATTIGQSVNIICRVIHGYPAPTVSWQFRSRTASGFVSIPKSDEYDNMVHISNVDETNAGTYKCAATNEVGDDEVLISLFVQNAPTISDAKPHWVSFNPVTDVLPPDAIVGGYQNESLYIARAPHEGSLTPGMYVPSIHKAYVTWSTDAHPKTVFEILCGRNYKWVPTTTDYIPDGAVLGGYIENSYETEYIGRTNYSGYVIPGKVAVSHGVLYFAYEGRTTAVKNFEILVEVKQGSPKVTGKARVTVAKGQSVSIECNVVEGAPKPTISWLFKFKTYSRFTAIPGSDNVLRLSNVNATDAGTYKCVATNDVGQDQHLTELIVLDNMDEPHWVSFNPDTDELPADAIVGGYQNETLYIARAPHEGSLSPGMYVPSTHRAYVTWSTDAHPKTEFELLCGRNYVWVQTTTDYIPDGAVVGGYIENSYEAEYIGRTNYNGYVFPGKVAVSHGVLYFAYEGRTTAVRNFDILVEVKPAKPVITGSPRVMATTGESVEIRCLVVQGMPNPTINWQYKPKIASSFVSIPGSGNLLRLSNANTADAGTYKCIATNDVGHDEHLTELVVPEGIIDPYWMPFDPDVDALPTDAIVGGYQNETLYIAVAEHEETMNPGMYIPSEHKAYITWGDDVYSKSEIKILRGDNYIWVSTTTDYIPEIAFRFRGGYLRNRYYETLYVCKANYSGHVIPGKVAVSYGGCQIADGGKTVAVTNFEILVVPKKRGARITGKYRETVVEGQPVNIECTVTEGIPKPTISWEFKAKSGLKFVPVPGSGNVLRISRADEADAGTYKCIASNDVGYAMHRTELIVETLLDDYGIIHELDLIKHMQSPTFALKCSSGKPSEIISWFNNGVRTATKGDYILQNLDMSYEGQNYTCRVSDGNFTAVHTFVFRVSQLQFTSERGDSIVLDLTDRDDFELNCDFIANTPANISWTFNGKLMENQNSSRLTFVGNLGIYTCKVTTIDGTIQRSFNITLSKCFIPREPKYVNTMPLISTATAMLDYYNTNYMKVEPGQSLILSCPDFENKTNHFQMFPLRKEIKVQCVKGDQFIVKDKTFKLSDLVCAQEVKMSVIEKHQKCWPNNNNSELLGVGFGSSETFEVCFDTANNMPLYISGKISIMNGIGDVEYKWQKYGAPKARDAYTCDNPTSTCCYAKAQLINAGDVSAGSMQRSTFIDPLNAVMLWRPCDLRQTPWAVMESSVRRLTSLRDEFKVWSGTYLLQNKNGTIIPRYLWKAVEKTIALIYINDPSPTKEDILCTNICGTTPPWPSKYKKYIYCCDLKDFLVSFGLEATNVGEPLRDGFRQISLRL